MFLLSYAEAWKYFPGNSEHVCQLTAYASARGAYEKQGNCRWWLRSPGRTQIRDAYVGISGECSSGSSLNVRGCVRPVFWINLEYSDISGYRDADSIAQSNDVFLGDAAIIVKVGDDVFTKDTIQSMVQEFLQEEQNYYNQYYGQNIDITDKSLITDAQNDVIDRLIRESVLAAKAKEFGLDKLSEEDQAEVDDFWQQYYDLAKNYMFGETELNTTSGIALDVCQAGYSASKAALDKITIDLGSRVQGTDVLINLTDPGWCRTDLGGPHAPNAPESAIPGIVVGVFVDDRKSGRFLGAQHFTGMTLEEAVKKAETEFDSPYPA